MSRPEISLQQKGVVMKKKHESGYVKRTQKDYSMSLKLQVVKEIESGHLSTRAAQRKYGIQSRSTVVAWLRKYGTFDWETQTPSNMEKTPEQRIMELEQKVRLLEKQKAFLEHQVERADKKVILFDMMITVAEEELGIEIRKKSKPE